MYNVKVIEYPTGIQVRVFDKAIKEERWNCDEWGEIPEKPEKAETDEQEVDRERSALVSANRSLNMVYKYARANIWEWFFTLTFNPDRVDSFDYEAVTKAFKNWIDNVLRRRCPDVKYLFVPEKHESGRYHFHGLVSNCDGLKFTDSGHKDKGGKTIYNVASYRLGFSTATMIEDTARASSYLSKYISKDLAEHTLGKRRYWCSKNLDLPMEYIAMYSEKDIKALKRELITACDWCKTVQGDFQTTAYFEGSVRSISACIRAFMYPDNAE